MDPSPFVPEHAHQINACRLFVSSVVMRRRVRAVEEPGDCEHGVDVLSTVRRTPSGEMSFGPVLNGSSHSEAAVSGLRSMVTSLMQGRGLRSAACST